MTDTPRRRLKVLTASKTALALLCTQFLDIDAVWNESSGIKAEVGHIAHEEIQAGLEQAKAIYLACKAGNLELPRPKEGYFKQAMQFLSDHCLDQWGPMEVERSYGMAGDEPVMLGHNRDYSNAPEGTWLTGTADVAVPEDMLLTIIDWKTGNATKALEQLLALGVLASGGYEDNEILRVLSVHVDTVSYSVGIDHTCTIGEARAHIAELRTRLEKGPSKTPGDHCYNLYCPHAEVCLGAEEPKRDGVPRVQDVDLRLVTDSVLLEMFTREKVREQSAGRALDTIKREMARRGGISTPSGFFTERYRNVPRMDNKALLALAKARGATDTEIDNCKRMHRESAGWRVYKDKS